MLLIVIIFTNSWFTIPQAVLKIYELADVRGVEIAVNEEECKILTALNIGYITKNKNEVCVLRNANIESKIGSNFLIMTDDGKRLHLSKDGTTLNELPPSGIIIKQHENANYEIVNGNKNIKNLRVYAVYVNNKTNTPIKEKLLLAADYLKMKETKELDKVDFWEENDSRVYFEIRIKNKRGKNFQRYSHIEN